MIDFVTLNSDSVNAWFSEYSKRVEFKEQNFGVFNGSVEHFVNIERSVASIDKKIDSASELIEESIRNMSEVAENARLCQFYSNAVLISINNTSNIENEEQKKSFKSRIIKFAHGISNWIFALFDI